MINNKKVLALIPARGGSKGLPGKNIKQMCGVPLIGWPIKAALNSKYIDKLIVSTDDENIAAIARGLGADVPFIRPKKIAMDETPTIDVINHAIQFLESSGDFFDYIVLLEATSPLTEATDIDCALNDLYNAKDIAKSIVGVAEVELSHPSFCVKIGENKLISPYLGKSFSAPVRRQDVSQLHYFEGTLYISTIDSIKHHQSFHHDSTMPYLVPKWKAFEVDTLTDFICIEAIMKNKEKLN